MRLPRDLSGEELARALARFGYEEVRTSGSHLRLTAVIDGSAHHITIPLHRALRVGTLSAILTDIADHLGMSRDDLAERLLSGRR